MASHPEGLQGFGLGEKVPTEEVRVGQLFKECTISLRDPILSLCPGISALPGPHCKASFKRLSRASSYVLGACQVLIGSKLCKRFPSPLLSCLVESVWRWLGWICKAPLLWVAGSAGVSLIEYYSIFWMCCNIQNFLENRAYTVRTGHYHGCTDELRKHSRNPSFCLQGAVYEGFEGAECSSKYACYCV